MNFAPPCAGLELASLTVNRASKVFWSQVKSALSLGGASVDRPMKVIVAWGRIGGLVAAIALAQQAKADA